MSAASTQAVMDRYFAAMGAEEDFSSSYTTDVTWSTVDVGHEVHGASEVRDYLLDLHGRMAGGHNADLVVTDDHAYLEGDGYNAESGPGLSFCLVYDVEGDHITAMRCYGTVGRLMAAEA